jgi:thiol-disulfide isomerase/thioredoxin
MRSFLFFLLMCVPGWLYAQAINPALRADVLNEAAKHYGKTAPCFELCDADSNVVNCRDFAGKLMVIEFWFTSCPPCLAELPYVKVVQEVLKADTSVAFISICVDNMERRSEWLRLLQQHNPSGTQLFLPKNKPAANNNIFYGRIGEYPTFLLVAPGKKVLGSLSYPSEWMGIFYEIERGKQNIAVKQSLGELLDNKPVAQRWMQDNAAKISQFMALFKAIKP